MLTLALESHKEDMPPYVYNHMEHVRSSMSSNINKILHYASVKRDYVDYRLESISILDIVEECLREFLPMAEEQKVDIKLSLPELMVTCDKRVLSFMLSQLLSNAFKYTASENGIINISCWEDKEPEGKIYLAVRDNGKGAPEEDIPFLFDKGFTGSSPERQKATGMGLYLVKKYAEALSIGAAIEPSEVWDHGFGIELVFPKVD